MGQARVTQMLSGADMANRDWGASRRQVLTGGALTLTGLAAACGPGGENGPSAGPGQGAGLDDAALTRLAGAEHVSGVTYTEAERAQILAGLDGQLETLRALRTLEKPNTLAPAMTFDPRLPGVSYDQPGAPAGDLGLDGPPALGDDDSIAFAPAHHLRVWLQTGQLSSRDLTELYLKRIERFNPDLEAWVSVDREGALAAADQADRERAAGRVRGPLHGVPYGLKDLFDAEGLVTTWGATPYKDAPRAESDSAVVARLREAGAVLLGKTSCGALAYGDIWFGGVTKNPWDPREGSSGSSAGSASAVAAGLCAFAIGTETLGSIVSPSNRCGTTGLRPTFGRVSRAGGMALCWSLDKVGPIARSVADCGLVLGAISGGDVGDPSSLGPAATFPTNARVDPARLTVGFDPAWFESALEGDRLALEAVRALGASVREVAVPTQPTSQLVQGLVVEAAAAFEDLTLSNRDDELVWQEDNAWPNTFRQARFISAIDYVQIDRIRREVMTAMHGVFVDNGVDALIGPNFAGGMLTITNFTGHPQLALRAGFQETRARSLAGQDNPDAEPARTPYTTSLWAPLLREDVLVSLGTAIEARLGVRDERPRLG